MARANDWKNGAINMDDFGNSRPALKADTIKPANATVITITDVDLVVVPDSDRDDGKRKSLVLSSEEYPDRGYWLNRSGIKTLVERFGEAPSSWIGHQVPLVVASVNNPRLNVDQPSLQVASPEQWDDVMASFTGEAAPVRRTSAKRAAAKKAAKRGRRSQ